MDTIVPVVPPIVFCERTFTVIDFALPVRIPGAPARIIWAKFVFDVALQVNDVAVVWLPSIAFEAPDTLPVPALEGVTELKRNFIKVPTCEPVPPSPFPFVSGAVAAGVNMLPTKNLPAPLIAVVLVVVA